MTVQLHGDNKNFHSTTYFVKEVVIDYKLAIACKDGQLILKVYDKDLKKWIWSVIE
jgi:hypothetical protein